MNGYIKYFENGGKNMSLSIKNDKVGEKYVFELFMEHINTLLFLNNSQMQINSRCNLGKRQR